MIGGGFFSMLFLWGVTALSRRNLFKGRVPCTPPTVTVLKALEHELTQPNRSGNTLIFIPDR